MACRRPFSSVQTIPQPMTETEWLSCTDPTQMLTFARGKASPRKLRLFAAACCRRIWEYMDSFGQQATELAEQFADETTTRQVLVRHRRQYSGPSQECSLAALAAIRDNAWAAAAFAGGYAAGEWASVSTGYRPTGTDPWPSLPQSWRDRVAEEKAVQTQIARCIFGCLFKHDCICRETQEVCLLARSVYEEPAFDRLSTLAEALEETGCTEAGILNHCRSPGPHVRGCWVVDLLLGKQ